MLFIIIRIILKMIIIFLTIYSVYEMFLIFKIKKKIEYGKITNRLNKNKFIQKINYYILEIKNSSNKNLYFLNSIIILTISTFLSIITFIVMYLFTNIFSTSLIFSFFVFIIPYLIIEYIVNNQKNKILSIFPMYAISLKNYTKSTNNIIIAFKKVKIEGILSIYVDKFNLSIEKGISVFESFENLKKQININKISEFITASQYSYINGGDFNKLLDRFSNILLKSNIQKEKEKEESFSSKLVLGLLLIINIYVLFTFILLNDEYKNIMLNTLFGKIIINTNIISYMLIFLFIRKINKLEE